MTEFDYDVIQRKKLARQARYKKNGSKSKKCTLRQDTMTDAQLKKMNGEVIRFRMNKPIRSWKEFRRLSKVSAREYIADLTKKYGVSVGDLSRMFGVSYNTVKTYLIQIEADMPSGRMPADMVLEWEQFLSGSDDAATCSEVTSSPAEENHAMESPSTGHRMTMRELAFEFQGDINYVDVVNSLRHILGDSPTGFLRVEYRTPGIR